MYASLKYAVGGFTALDSTNIDPCLMYASLTYAVGGFTVCGHRLALKRIVMTSIWPYHHQMLRSLQVCLPTFESTIAIRLAPIDWSYFR